MRVMLIAPEPDCKEVEQAINVMAGVLAIELRYLSLDGPLRDIVECINLYNPEIIFIGQTDRAEEVLQNLRMPFTPLIVRWSRYFGQDRPIYTDRTPSVAGYHLDIPKSADSIAAFIKNEKLLTAISHRDLKAVSEAVAASTKTFAAVQNWGNYLSTPPLKNLIVDFMYLDNEGIDRLFAQTGKAHIESVVRKNSRSTSGKASGSLKIGKILEMFGLGGADLNGSLDHGRTSTEEVTEKLTTIGKLKIVVDSLSSSLTVMDVRRQYPALKNLAEYIDFTAWFRTREEIERVAQKNDRAVEFTEFPCNGVPITMGASLAKYQVGFHHVRIMLGCDQSLIRVIGALTPVGSGYYLKPYAFWPLGARWKEESSLLRDIRKT